MVLNMIYTRTMIQLHKELLAKYQVSSTIRHKGEKGRNREHGLAMFLRENLPERYGVATGEIIPFKGDLPSPQCDIIIYDRLTFPIIGKSSAVQQVPYEAVYSVIEVKSQITNRTLDETLEKFSTIRQLPRCELKRGARRSKNRNPLFVLFGYELDTRQENCKEFIAQGVNEDIFLVALDTGFTLWLGSSKKEAAPIFLTATDTATSLYETLAWFFGLLLDSLNEIDLGTPKYFNIIYDGKYNQKV